MVWNGIKLLKSSCFSNFTAYFNICTHILSKCTLIVHDIMQKVQTLLSKYIFLCVVFRKNYDTRQKFQQPPVTTNLMFVLRRQRVLSSHLWRDFLTNDGIEKWLQYKRGGLPCDQCFLNVFRPCVDLCLKSGSTWI